jgi:V/A-type H+/Na+-transporting ATPase subunit E
MKAARIRREAVGSAGLEARAYKTRRRELLIQRVFDEALERLANPTELEDYKAVVKALVGEASEHLGGLDVVKVTGDKATLDLMDQEFLDHLADVIGYHVEVGEPLLQGSGIMLESPDGRLRYDNTFQTRLSRMRSALRASVYRILMGEAQEA